MIQSNPIYRNLRSFWHRQKFARLTLYDKHRLGFYSRFIRPGALVFDVGANLGNRTKIFLRLGARVVAFEPQTECADFLTRMLGKHRKFRLVRKALGPFDGTATMFISNSHTISSLSEGWINATVSSGRFASYQWTGREEVEVTTLNNAIAAFGLPSFVKIDVEGFEHNVLTGLSRPVECLSIEVTPEYLENTYRCLERLETLANFEFQFSFGESMCFEFPKWISTEDLRRWMKDLPHNSFGDLYARSRRG